MGKKDVFTTAYFNMKKHKRSSICSIVVIALVTIVLIATMFVCDKVTQIIERGLDDCVLYVFSGNGKDEELYEKLKKDSRFSDVGYGSVITYIGVVKNAKELFGDKYADDYIPLDLSRLYNKYKECTDYTKELGLYEVLVPKYICMTEELENIEKKGDYIDGETLVGKTISLDIKGISSDVARNSENGVELKIVGTLDNAKAQEIGCQIYVSSDTIREFDISRDEIYAELSDIKYRNQILEEGVLSEYAFSDDDGSETISSMTHINVVGKLVFIVGMLATVMFIGRSTNGRMSEIAIMKAVGYEQKLINKIYGIEIAIIFAIGFVAAAVMSIIGFGILELVKNMKVSIVYAKSMQFMIEPKYILIASGFVLVFMVIAYGFAMDRISRGDILKAIKSSN